MNARAKNLARYHVFFGDAGLINTELERYMKVKREDLQRVAKEYFKDDRTQILHYPVPAPAEAPAAAPKSATPAK